MSSPVLTPSRHEALAIELDQARQRGPLRAIVIPPCPALLVRMREALDEAEPDLNEVASIAGSDVAMAATLIKAANSPAFSTGQPVQAVGQALYRLGLAQTAQLMVQFLTRRAIRVDSPNLQRFWERSTKRAVAMAYIAGRLPGMSADVAHTYGLFSHVGMPVMLQSLRGYAGTLVEANARIDRPFIATENVNHQTDHAVVGALVARVWGLGPAVMAAIRRHHDLDMLGDSRTDPDVHTLVAAGMVAEHLMRRHEGLEADADWRSHQDPALAWLQIDGAELAQWDEDLQPLFETV
jgi:HD-like signal output (HDOD) protein